MFAGSMSIGLELFKYLLLRSGFVLETRRALIMQVAVGTVSCREMGGSKRLKNRGKLLLNVWERGRSHR